MYNLQRGNGERLGVMANFHLADRRLLAFNYVYGSVYESDERGARERERETEKESDRRSASRGRGSNIPRRARRARTIMLDISCLAGDSAAGCLCP